MTRQLLLAALLALGASAPALAQAPCPCGSGTLVNNSSVLTNLLGNKTVCAVLGNERWQEWHMAGNLFELGDNFANPPLVGTWVASGSGANTIVTYAYGTGGAGGTYRYSVCQDGGNLHFCGSSLGGRNITNAVLLDNKAQCGFAASSLRPTVTNLPGRTN